MSVVRVLAAQVGERRPVDHQRLGGLQGDGVGGPLGHGGADGATGGLPLGAPYGNAAELSCGSGAMVVKGHDLARR